MTTLRFRLRLVAAALACTAVPAIASAQRGRPVRAVETGATTTNLATKTNLTITAVNVPRAEVEAATPAPALAPSGRRPSLADRMGASLKKAAIGDDARMKAARSVLAARVQQAVTDANATIVVVIGTTDDLKKVETSLALTQRPIVLAFVDRDLDDATAFNTALSAGIVGSVGADQATNLWVFMPRRGGAVRSKADHVLPLMTATPTMWNALFATDGDDLNVDQLRQAVSRPTPEARAVPSTETGALFNEGDVTTAKISGAKVYSEATATAAVAGTVSKTDELIVQGSVKNGMVSVLGANVTGWIAVAMLNRPLAR